MLRTSIPDLTAHLRSYGIPPHSTVIIHSSLFHFGLFDGGAQRFFRMIEDVLGETCTVVMPAFNWEFTAKRHWDYFATRSQSGVLTEYMRKLPGTTRTIHPFHSVTVRGPNEERIARSISSSSFGPGSAFETLYDLDAYNLSLGSPFVGGATFCHHAEEVMRVPYRFHKEFPGTVVDAGGQPVDRTFSMYVRVIEADHEYVNTWDVFWDDLLATGIVRHEKYNGVTPILLMKIRDAHDRLAENIRRDPYYVAQKVPRPAPQPT